MFVQIAQLKKRAKEKGISLSYLCRSVNKNTSYLHNIERYNIQVPEEVVGLWAGLLDTTIEFLTGEEDNPTIPEEKMEEDEMKVALFGGDKATDEEWEEVKRFVAYLKSKRNEQEHKS